MTSRREQQEVRVMDEVAQLEEEKKAEREYEELLRQEAERLRIQGYQPQVSLSVIHYSAFNLSFVLSCV